MSAVMSFANAPEPRAWVVVYSPSTKVVERGGFTSLSNEEPLSAGEAALNAACLTGSRPDDGMRPS